MKFQTINPVDNSIINTYSFLKEKEIKDKLIIAHKAYEEWKGSSFYSRVKSITRLSYRMQEGLDILSYSITQEMGKPITQSREEINKSINLCKYYSSLEESIFFKNISTEYEKSYIIFEPIGAILGIMPWNYPIWQTIRCTIPNILLGNVMILKPAINTAGCSILLEKIFVESGFPKGVFQVFLVENHQIESLIAHSIIQGVAFTGSHLTGSHIGYLSGKYIKKSILELGGNDAFVVMKDVNNIQESAKFATKSRLNNTGQSCISAKRFIVDNSIVDDFIDLVIQEMKKYHRGDLYEKYTKIGYISRIDLSEKLHQQYKKVISNGGTVCLESTRDGNFFSPSLLKIKMENYSNNKEEIFGPIGLVYSFSKEEEIPFIVNYTCYGLGASIWTKDLKKAEVLSKKINTGMVFINEIVKSDPRFPFGGVKKSGYGRELSVLSIKEFSNWKTIIIKKRKL
ncbi:MAG: aldehyde dehydrogenase family protein [Flavobacteriales bacterium]|jgi:succinate-semialdehyde dehydrogenase/glutarate-semialdehyde dehydrogenase|uniref:aldehyde dehydrogenase family protein n=1 Tax=Blattabacterium sp. (Mastotermes darwiniensis) TaxID=39768 RepID=UPI000231DEDD|nr:aldehyde dehydrogenase family protein [Blattabacterium sp. (Mastotermes darwiniensis)]AER40785.1 succinate-semialdehyde dehydrogenase [Blattabacterium sp. (Mastotermes darwiniensis) str. MADAR]MDR1804630.1 aldehyde dehydrogenase family protein [Flavobacteriales bacterium]